MSEQIKLFAEYGCWAFVALLVTGIGILWREVIASHSREIALAKQVLPLSQELKNIVSSVLD